MDITTETRVPVATDAVMELDDPALYTSRELSWLAFNDRVLEEALDERNPLLERLKFIAIFGTNLDEYFMIRVAALKQQVEAEISRRSEDGRLPEESLAAITERLRPSLDRAVKCLRQLLFALERYGLRVFPFERLDTPTREALNAYFRERVFPVLTPLGIDKGHPFPYISNLSLSLAIELEEATPTDGPIHHVARVKVPEGLPRFVAVPGTPEGQRWFVLLEDLIANNLPALFPGLTIVGSSVFRVTRDADLDIQEDEADDLLQAIESELRRRRFGEPVRLEVQADMPAHLRTKLLNALDLGHDDCYEMRGMLATSDLWTLVGSDRPTLHDPPFTPAMPKRLVGTSDVFAAIREGDILLHHPYESFDPVVQFVQQAARDPRVLAIKQTLYRTSGNSPIVNALVEAAENGKQVAALIELKARFDEENNINWARNLERVGAHVVYGFAGLKTHGKVTLVVRNEPDGIRRYMHFGTGNYNDKTAKIYTDLSLFTCRPELGADATQLFNSLTGFSKHITYDELLVAPLGLRSGFESLIARDGGHPRAHHGEAERDHGQRHRPRALSRLAGGREDRSDRARHVRPLPRRARHLREHHGALDRRAIPRTFAHLRLRERGRTGSLHGQRRLDGAQSRSPRRDRGARARSGDPRRDPPRDPRRVARGQRQIADAAAGRNLRTPHAVTRRAARRRAADVSRILRKHSMRARLGLGFAALAFCTGAGVPYDTLVGDTAIMVTPERLHARSCRDLIARTEALRASGGHLARTLIGYRYELTPEPGDASRDELAVAVDTAKTTVMLPDLTWPGMSAEESAAIATLTNDILAHEHGHLRIAFAAVEAFNRERHSVPRGENGEALFARFFRTVSDEQIAYDALTEHGVHQSRAAGDLRGNDLVIRCPSGS